VTGFAWAVVSVFGCLAMTALGDMVSEEVRDRLDHLPHAILHVAAMRLDSAQRVTVYEDEWLPELAYILKGDEARPITRLISGSWFAVGILVKSNRITQHLHRPLPEQPPLREHSSPTLTPSAAQGEQNTRPSLSTRLLSWRRNVRCPACFERVSGSSSFCPECGSSLEYHAGRPIASH
jgi:hypothetical protein